MMSWKDDADKELAKRVEKQRRRDLQEKNTREEKARKDADDQLRRRLNWHYEHFRCHICQRPSSGPRHMPAKIVYEEYGFRPGGYAAHRPAGLDWNIPTGLTKCNSCYHWACDQHFHKGWCQKCWEKSLKK